MIKEAIREFAGVLGSESVITNPERLIRYHYATIPVERDIDAALQPKSVEEVQNIIRIAGRYGIHLYPISTGNNWGYGSANPIRDNNVIVDMSRMNRIVKVDKELAYAVIEPGVTQQQLYQHLHDNKTGLMMDPTGSGPSCSVLGNALERGYGISPYGDHFEAICGMEVVLSDGQIFRTGFWHYDHANASHLFKYGAGPYLDGIFTQSNYGIVTKIGLWLMPEPEHFEACYFLCKNHDALGPLIDATRWLLLNRVVKGSINLVHRNRSLTMLSQYPWEAMEGRTPLGERVWQALANEKNVGIWNGVMALYGTREEVKAAKKTIKRKLRGIVTKIQFLSEGLLRFTERFQRPIGTLMRMNIPELIKVLKPSYGLLKGQPCEVSLPSPYWRMKRTPPSSDINPARDNCGLFWFAPVVPMKKENAEEFMGIVYPIFEKHGFEACITFTTVTHRAFDCTLPILYDKENPDETERATHCYKDVLGACMKKGYIPYRFGIQSMEELVGREDVFWDIVEKLKKTFDPQGIISPGRYCR